MKILVVVILTLFWQLYVQNSPTNVIFGVAITFLIVWELCPAIVVAAVVGLVNVLTTEDEDIPPVDVVVVVAAAPGVGVGLVGDFAAAVVVVVTVPADVEPAVWPGDTTTGSVEGIGFPSLVCSFKTYKIWEELNIILINQLPITQKKTFQYKKQKLRNKTCLQTHSHKKLPKWFT